MGGITEDNAIIAWILLQVLPYAIPASVCAEGSFVHRLVHMPAYQQAAWMFLWFRLVWDLRWSVVDRDFFCRNNASLRVFLWVCLAFIALSPPGTFSSNTPP